MRLPLAIARSLLGAAPLRVHVQGGAALFFLAAALGVGCNSSKAKKNDGLPRVSGGVRNSRAGQEAVYPLVGKVTFVNPGLRFVILDFRMPRMPSIDQRLGIYRGESRIGTVKITGPYLDTTVAGDIVIGEAELGDEVRGD